MRRLGTPGEARRDGWRGTDDGRARIEKFAQLRQSGNSHVLRGRQHKESVAVSVRQNEAMIFDGDRAQKSLGVNAVVAVTLGRGWLDMFRKQGTARAVVTDEVEQIDREVTLLQ